MRKNKKIAIIILTAALVLGLSGVTEAATTVNLGTAGGFAVLAGAGITIAGAVNSSTVTGDIGTFPTTSITGLGNLVLNGTNHAGDAVTQGAKDDLVTAYNNAAGQTPSLVPAELGGHTMTPGVYKNNADLDSLAITGTLTLDAQGDPNAVFIFQSGSTLTTAAGSQVVLINGAQACHVFWQLGSSATLGTNSVFKGNILALTSATLTTGANVEGSVLARNGAVTLDTNTIARATCAVVPSGSGVPRTGTINVVKVVINDNGGTKTIADFPLFVGGTSVVSGITNSFRTPGGIYTVTETADPNYVRSFSGDCDANGDINLSGGDNKVCIVTNNDIGKPIITPPVPPLLDLVKVPSPLALPNGPGAVTYTYTLRNIGTVPVSNITMVGDTCSPITLASGDTNANGKLEVNETWKYTCSTTLSETHTNTVVATGWANGISATDIANATVVVGQPIVPPLIHVTKIPKPLALRAGGGTVVYTNKVTNPGTVALSNVRLVDDKCSSVRYISGDANKNSKLDTNETWTYTCQGGLAKTTTNTVIATGEANGLTARDFAIATVVVADVVPKLPNTGLMSGEKDMPWTIMIFSGIFILISASFVLALKKNRT